MDPYEQYIASPPKQCAVCGGTFDGKAPITKEFTGEYFTFCSTECLGAFEADPERYARPDDDDENGDS